MPAPAVSAELQQRIEQLSPGQQAALSEMLQRTAERYPDFDSVALIHQYLKADPDYTDFSVYENLGTLKGPKVVKDFPDAQMFALPRDFQPLDASLEDLLALRSSRYNYGPEGLTLQTLSTFLHAAYGVKRSIQAYNIKEFPVRNAPSAGGLQPVDLYLVINQVEGLPKGLYYYNPVEHAVVLLDEGNMRSALMRCCIFTEFVLYAPVVCIMTCNMDRVRWKYGDRSYRFVHVDTGVLTQNLYLVGTALNLNVCALAAYYDDQIHELLGVDGREEFVSLLFSLGPKPFGGALTEA